MTVGSSSEVAPFDVTICGGGLAGLTLARQLNMRMPELKVLVIDKTPRPLPIACHKVGESSIEGGATYFSKVLQLTDYLQKHQLPKLGLRFFWGSGTNPLEKRSEYGISEFPPEPTVQLDRGTFESDLREMAIQTGSTLWEGYGVDDIELSETGGPHKVIASKGGETRVVQTRWVIDAMGRRQFLKRKLELEQEFGRKHSSSWWRYKGRVDLSDFVPQSETNWHARVPGRTRYYSTNHFLGNHYWFWLIPLASGYTSAGIVADEEHQPFDTFNTFERSMEWLKTNEPVVWKFLQGLEPQDFLVMRRYTYSAKQVFSHHRWALVGEAGVFSDPYFSTGSDLIGAANCIVSELIRLDMRENSLPETTVQIADQGFLMYSRFLTDNIQRLYDYNQNAVVGGARYLWGNVIGPPLTLPVIIGFLHKEGCLSNKEKLAALPKFQMAMGGLFALSRVMLSFFDDWLAKSPNTGRFEFIDYLRCSLVNEMFATACKPELNGEELVATANVTISLAERLAQALFLVAVEDVFPEHIERFTDPVWINAWAISLHPERWEEDGLFKPTTTPVDITAIRRELRGFFWMPSKADGKAFSGFDIPPEEAAEYLKSIRDKWRGVQ